MGCFVAPLTEAVVVTAAAVIVRQKEKKHRDQSQNLANEKKEGISSRLFRLSKLLFGGAVLLIFEHIWHGEVVPYFPFFTAATEGDEAVIEMWQEIGTSGVLMAVLCTLVWGVIEVLRYIFAKKNVKKVVVE